MVKEYLKQCKKRLSFKKDEKGAITILTTIFLAVIIFFVFFIVFDYTTYNEQEQKVQYFADNAAAAVAQKSAPALFPTVVDKNGVCYAPTDINRTNPITCDVIVEEVKVLFDAEEKLIQKTDGIAHQLARETFNLDENMQPVGERNPITKYKMTVEIYDAIDGQTFIETDNGKYEVTKPTVVVKIWATIKGPFLGREIEKISVGVYEASDKFIGQ